MTAAAEILRYVELVVFVAAAALAGVRWLRRRGAARAWLAATFAPLGGVVAAAELAAEPVESSWRDHALVAALLLFPYFLYRFMATFERPPRALGVVSGALESAPPPANVTVTAEVDGVTAVADHDRLEEIVVNLLTNAYRYGGRTVRVAAECDGGRVTLAVSDDGPGVAPEFVPELFEPFTRAGEVTGTPGSGLGLAISRRLAAALGGDLSYDGSRRGARFVLSLRGAV